jgi:hypothetical protein
MAFISINHWRRSTYSGIPWVSQVLACWRNALKSIPPLAFALPNEARDRLRRPRAQYTDSRRKIAGRSFGDDAGFSSNNIKGLTFDFSQDFEHFRLDDFAVGWKISAGIVQRDQDSLGTRLAVSNIRNWD